MSPERAVTLVAVACVTMACASGGAATGAAGSGSPRSTSSRLESADFQKPEFQTMYDVIHTLRPDWMVAHGGEKSTMHMSTGDPVVGVFIEGQQHGYGMDKLGELKPAEVASVRFMRAGDTMAIYGPQWAWGGIIVTLSR